VITNFGLIAHVRGLLATPPDRPTDPAGNGPHDHQLGLLIAGKFGGARDPPNFPAIVVCDDTGYHLCMITPTLLDHANFA